MGRPFRLPHLIVATMLALASTAPQAVTTNTNWQFRCSGCHGLIPQSGNVAAAASAPDLVKAIAPLMGVSSSPAMTDAQLADVTSYIESVLHPSTKEVSAASTAPVTIDVSGDLVLNGAYAKLVQLETVTPPAGGTVVYNGASITFTPPATGTYVFSYRARNADGSIRTSTRTVTVTVGSSPGAADNHTALWWNSSEAGWGINFTQQGDIVFGTLFDYDATGSPLWLVMSNGARQSGETFSGPLYRTTGPAFNADPFTPIGPSNITTVGAMTVSFSGDTALLTYTLNGASVTKTIQKQVYGSRAATCQSTTLDRSALANYQDLWWNPAESGWGINITHQDEILFATLFTYNANGQGLWLVMSRGARQADGSYLGDLYQTTGPAFNAQPFTPITGADIAKVGTMQLRFASGTTGTLAYTVNGVAVTKSITRQVFSSPVPACTS